MEGFDGKLYLIDFGRANKIPKNDENVDTAAPIDYFLGPCMDLRNLCQRQREVGWKYNDTTTPTVSILDLQFRIFLRRNDDYKTGCTHLFRVVLVHLFL